MKINIFGSTGEIGSKSLYIINKYFPKIKINLLVANNNYKKLITQIKIYNPKYVYINNEKAINKIQKKIKPLKTKILLKDEIENHLSSSFVDLTILSISGYQALYYFNFIIKNTKYLGLVNKETIVSAGHLFNKIFKKNKLKLYPLDSEHYSLNSFFQSKFKNSYNSITLTATGGPFLFKNYKNITFKQAIKHPKWKMGYKNSIDSATLANKCLEVVEAHYLFNIPYNKIDIIIHSEAFVHSIIELKDWSIIMNSFFPDMFIPIFNFLSEATNQKKFPLIEKFKFGKKRSINFVDINHTKYPIFKIFQKIDKKHPTEIIKFNCSNEIAVEKFKSGKLKFNQIHEFIDNSLSLDFNHSVNTLDQVIDFQKNFKSMLSK